MLVKCETKSSRVKGMSFHPKLSWIIASLHNGVLQLWDYRIGSLIDKFEEHKGPVRGVSFHHTQPLFVSGGDDSTVKVWNYHQRRCIFTLCGHLDYIRTVQFHSNYPWILSASDDQTVRIWNWQSRNCIAVLTGHNHYVMCAQFHPHEDIVVSASLDQTIRVWNVRGLREKTVSISSDAPATQYPHHVDMFGTSDAICKFVLEGHDRGINHVCFHHSLPFIASAADDRFIKLWRYDGDSAWEVDTLRGHFNNVSCIAFHTQLELLLSNSEDRTIRVWDIIQRVCVHTYRRENDRFWALSIHEHSNLIAVGHDSGMVVFKMDRERPPFSIHENYVFHIKSNSLMAYDYSKGVDVVLSTCRKPVNAMSTGPKEIYVNQHNSAETNVLILYKEGDTHSYDLLSTDPLTSGTLNRPRNAAQSGSGTGISLVFISRNRFVILETSTTLGIYNLSNEISKRLELPCAAEKLFPALHNKVLVKYEDAVALFDTTSRKLSKEVHCPGGVRNIVWSEDGQLLALLSKHNIVLTNSKLETNTSFHENIRVKGGAFDENGAFIYSTLNHVKYCLPNGDQGIILSLVDPIYIVRIFRQQLTYLDRSGTVHTIPLRCEEYLIKLALQKRQFDQVALLVKNGRLFGNSLIGYLRNKGYSEVAMRFVNDPATRFSLALEHEDITEASKCAAVLNDKVIWNRLGTEAFQLGDHHVAEMTYQKVKNYDKLSFLYLITGNIVKLGKMLTIAEAREDAMSRYQNALLLGDAKERVRVLAEVGQIPLASLVAQVNHLHSFSSKLEEYAHTFNAQDILPENPRLLTPPLPVYRTFEMNHWPMAYALKNKFESAMELAEFMPDKSVDLFFQGNGVSKKKQEDLDLVDSDEEDALNEADEWGHLDDIVDFKSLSQGDNSIEDWTIDKLVETKTTPKDKWLSGQPMVADLVAAGEFMLALSTLKNRIGLINAAPLKQNFIRIFQSTWSYLPGPPLTGHLSLPVLSSGTYANPKNSPIRLFSTVTVLGAVRSANKLMIGGKFQESLYAYREILQYLPLVVATSKAEEEQLQEFVHFCRVYITAMRLECLRKSLPETELVRNLELVCYLACCPLQPSHSILTLRRAMIICSKAGNYLTAAFFGKRLIEGEFGNSRSTKEEIQKAKLTVVQCEEKGKDAYEIDFKNTDFEKLSLCTVSLTLVPPADSVVHCPYCSSMARAKYEGTLCQTCELSKLGASGLGVQFYPLI